MIPALSRFALLIINALQPAASMERNRLTGTCEKTGTGPQGASHCPGGACLKVPVELRALLLGTTLAVLPQRRQEDLSLGYPPMSNISVGARAQLRPEERVAYHLFQHLFTQKYVFVPGTGHSNKQDRQDLCAFGVSFQSEKQTIKKVKD